MPGLDGLYVRPADLAISLGYGPVQAFTEPTVVDAMSRVQASADAAGLIAGIHAGDGRIGNRMAQNGFRMTTLVSESQALRRGAMEHLREATGDRSSPTAGGGYS